MSPSVAHRESVADVPISVFSRLPDALNAVLRALDEAVMAASVKFINPRPFADPAPRAS
jgi:hypothetical protein